MTEEKNNLTTWQGILALSPIVIFLVFYLGVSLWVGDFYKVPVSVAFILAVVWAVLTTRGMGLAGRVDLFSRGAANGSVLYMIWIFILAGAFAALAKGIGAIDATVAFALQTLPAELIIPGIFVSACFISVSIGTSVGTVVALTPFATEIAGNIGVDTAFPVAVVIGGAFFGDNLSFISDTTIAATRSQDCRMSDKFRANILIALPAALLTLLVYIVISTMPATIQIPEGHNYALIIPYLVVIVTAAIGVNVLIVLMLGIVTSVAIALPCTDISVVDMLAAMGTGITGMGDLIVVTLLASGLLGLIKHNGGIHFIINWLTRHISGPRGAQGSIALLVSVVNVCTANNTIAIITVGELSKRIADGYGLRPRKVASILDTCSCIVQSILPYGAQALLAAGLSGLSPIAFVEYMYYPACLAIMVALSIIFRFPRPVTHRQA
ncbi:MAG: Na+/H+ antiporter NhaC family protein [Bacteroidales bacterium]|nr:Na+/H+ antiporter NhaC family protein [Bacteroidales bacterium]